MKTKKLFTIFISCLIILSACNNSIRTPEIDYKSLSKSGNWEVIKNDSSVNTGHIKLKDEIWLMHFLHWWPLNDSNNEISIDYTKNLLMNLWGMQFTLTGTEGETKVNGHKAFFIEGTLRNVVKTRFIVWNCYESNRQFLSDCNINISLKTQDDLLDLQVNNITNSICCHEMEIKNQNSKLPQQINYKDQNIVLNIPANWRSDLFLVSANDDEKTPGHYLNGVTEKQGAIWNLLTDSQKEINLIWKKSTDKLSVNSFNAALNSFFNDTLIKMQDTLKFRSYFRNTNSVNIIDKEGYIEGSGNFEIITEIENYAPIDTSFYHYKAFLWKNEETEYLLFSSMVAYNNMWGISFDLAPTELQFNSFVKDVVLKNINNHPIPHE
jgi:hypothetical protein